MALQDFDVEALDDVIHGRLRLGIMTLLAGVPTADFNELKRRLSASDGNLSAHLRKLEEAGYVAVDKSFVDRKSLTRVRLTAAGRTAFLAYLEAMSRIVDEARTAQA
jgi:DNA-binding MarR family transcriptional regulator